MPIYVYKCSKCQYLKEVQKPIIDLFYGEVCDTEGCTQKLGDREIPTLMDRQPTAPAFHLKGGGWAKDGYSGDSQ